MEKEAIEQILRSKEVDLGSWGGKTTLFDALSKLPDLPRSIATVRVAPGILVEETVMLLVFKSRIPAEEMERYLQENFPMILSWKASYIAFDGLRKNRAWKAVPIEARRIPSQFSECMTGFFSQGKSGCGCGSGCNCGSSCGCGQV